MKHAVKRIRGRRLQAIRDQMMRDNPLCVECSKQGVVRAWDEVDHTVALANGGTDTPDNRVGLCREHHLIKTAKDFGHQVILKRKIGHSGWPE